MKEPHSEGIATHIDPESCGELRKEGPKLDRGRCRLGIEPRNSATSGSRRRRRKRKATSDASLSRDANGSREVRDPGMYGNTLLENREILCPPGAEKSQAASGKSHRHTPTMHGYRKSDSSVVPQKFPNKAGQPVAEEMEGRGLAKGNMRQQNASRTRCRNRRAK